MYAYVICNYYVYYRIYYNVLTFFTLNYTTQATFASGKHELNVSTYQMCILMQFNNRESIPLSDLRAAMSEVPEPEFKRHLLSLCTPKYRILKKSSAGKVYYIFLVYCYVYITVLNT